MIAYLGAARLIEFKIQTRVKKGYKAECKYLVFSQSLI